MNIQRIQLIWMLLLVLGFVVMGGEKTEAKSVTASSASLPALAAFWNWAGTGYTNPSPALSCSSGCGWAGSLNAGISATVTYNARLVNHDTGLAIADGASLPVTTKIRIEQIPAVNTDISWVGTGYSLDSPYGYWVKSAGPLLHGCSGGDWVSSKMYLYFPFGPLGPPVNFTVDSYYLLNVDPSTSTLSSPSANLSCVGNVCTIMSPGPVSLSMNFSSTYGKFYMRYKRAGICAGNNVPLQNAAGLVSGSVPFMVGSYLNCNGASCLANGDYRVSIPTKTISFSLTAVSSNKSPDVPSLSVDTTTNSINTNFIFTARSTDPDGDALRYGFDFTGSAATPGSYVPATATLASGTSQNALYLWPIPGTYTVRVRAEDSKGGVSGWSTPVVVTVNNIVNGICGPATLVPSGPLPALGLCAPGTPTLPTLSGSNWTWGCNGLNGGASTLPNACVTSIPTYALTVVQDGSGAGTIVDTTPTLTSIDSTIPRNSESVPYNASRTLRATPTASSVTWSGCDTVSVNDCTVKNIIAPRSVTVTFSGLSRPGICGSANGGSFKEVPPIGHLCSSGVPSVFPPNLSGTRYLWNCNGTFGSSVNVPCSATQVRNYNWIETSP